MLLNSTKPSQNILKVFLSSQKFTFSIKIIFNLFPAVATASGYGLWYTIGLWKYYCVYLV